ncbi:MAG: CCA tRNA nucleotidyltransferase [Solirubrobacteraceae bacterium]|nr:CCA tRNA nucleotidyltransferase [Solirubrobacteraceae bacterium]
MAFRTLQLDPADATALLGAVRGLRGGPELLAAVEKNAVPAHLVGGAVRDLLIGSAPRELDVVVEDDVSGIVAALGGEAVFHERFGTATVTLPGGATVDLARARAETYPEPGALPEVEPAPIDIDLHRRDVTLNAIAIDLRSGTVRAAGPALEDLDEMRLRVLHPGSFTDDPTRLWRLVRYEVRLGADWDPITELLARAAVQSGALRTVSVARLASELRLALGEPDPYGALAAAQRLGLPPQFDLDAVRLEQTERLGDGLAPHRDLVLAALASADPLLPRMLDRKDETTLIDAALLLREPGTERRPGPLPDTAAGSVIRRRFEGMPLAAIAAAPDAAPAARWLQELREVRPLITGDDLLHAGVAAGPALGVGLAAARDAILDGHVGAHERDAQLKVALSAAC